MTECCGQPRAGRFCSECGRSFSALSDLLKYLRTTEKKLSVRARNERQKAESQPNSVWDDRADGNEKMAAKWKAWADALAELMARAESEARP